MSKADDGLRSLFHQHLRAGFHWVAVETGFTQKGVPDSNACGKGKEFWVESKSVRSGWRPKIDGFQVSWHEHRLRMGGKTFVAIRRRVDREGSDDLYLYHGSSIRRLFSEGMGEVLPLVHTTGSPGRWDWASVRSALLSTTFRSDLFNA